jgi:hypothetical protein
MQVLCKSCNMGKSNKDATDWRLKPSRELADRIKQREEVLSRADPAQRAKLEQLAWLRQNDVDVQIKKEADRQYKALWRAIETGGDGGG